jgi:hypothetical protein
MEKSAHLLDNEQLSPTGKPVHNELVPPSGISLKAGGGRINLDNNDTDQHN